MKKKQSLKEVDQKLKKENLIEEMMKGTIKGGCCILDIDTMVL